MHLQSTVDWGYLFGGALIIFTIRRLVFKNKNIALDLESHVLFAFLLFFIIGVAFNCQAIQSLVFALFITIAGYFGFLMGYKIASLGKPYIMGKLKSTKLQLPSHICLIYTVLYLSIKLIILIFSDKLPSIQEIINPWYSYSAAAHLDSIAAGEIKMIGTILTHLRFFTLCTFLICWATIFKKMKLLAVLLWILFIYTQFVAYIGRGHILLILSFPFYIIFLQNHFSVNKMKKISIVSLVGFSSLLLMSIMGALRASGNIRTFLNSPGKYFSLTISGVTSPIANALRLYHNNLSGSPFSYIIYLIALPVPRFLWTGKPFIHFNIEITELLSGMNIGAGHEILTYTFYGEALYYFGIMGPFVIMLFFGLIARYMERLICSNDLFRRIYPFFLINTTFTIRSLFATEVVFFIQILLFLFLLYLFIPRKIIRDAYEI